jgi:hypothetical protein
LNGYSDNSYCEVLFILRHVITSQCCCICASRI